VRDASRLRRHWAAGASLTPPAAVEGLAGDADRAGRGDDGEPDRFEIVPAEVFARVRRFFIGIGLPLRHNFMVGITGDPIALFQPLLGDGSGTSGSSGKGGEGVESCSPINQGC
jgi:hypothetical protein